jgi:hypothetical protein
MTCGLKKVEDAVMNLRVVNDVAERGVALLIETFNRLVTTSEEQKQELLLVAEEHRTFNKLSRSDLIAC